MKKLTTFILLLTTLASFSQSLKDKLQGNWICTKILDRQGNPAVGKFGESNEYLKFSFDKKMINITEAPFDSGFKRDVVFEADSIDLFPKAVIELPERIYKVRSIDVANLVLTTQNEKGGWIDYHFINETVILKNTPASKEVIDNGGIFIKHFKKNEQSSGANRLSEYVLTNEKLFVSPLFRDAATFGHWCTIHFVFPKKYPLDTLSDELIVEFDIDEKGAVSNAKVVQELGNELDELIIKLIRKTNKKWVPVKVNGQPIKSTLRFHFVFLLGIAELQFPWKT